MILTPIVYHKEKLDNPNKIFYNKGITKETYEK
jgi:hypothetical protein